MSETYPHPIPEGFAVESWTGTKCEIALPWNVQLGVTDLGFNLLTPCCGWLLTKDDAGKNICQLCDQQVYAYPNGVRVFFDEDELQEVMEHLLQAEYGVFGATLEAARAVEFLKPLVEELRRNNRAAINRMFDNRRDSFFGKMEE